MLGSLSLTPFKRWYGAATTGCVRWMERGFPHSRRRRRRWFAGAGTARPQPSPRQCQARTSRPRPCFNKIRAGSADTVLMTPSFRLTFNGCAHPGPPWHPPTLTFLNTASGAFSRIRFWPEIHPSRLSRLAPSGSCYSIGGMRKSPARCPKSAFRRKY